MKIWKAYGPVLSDDSRVSPPDLGIFQGEREDVIDWVDLNNPGFRNHLEDLKHPRVKLREIEPQVVGRESVKRLRVALKQKADADKALADADKALEEAQRP